MHLQIIRDGGGAEENLFSIGSFFAFIGELDDERQFLSEARKLELHQGRTPTWWHTPEFTRGVLFMWMYSQIILSEKITILRSNFFPDVARKIPTNYNEIIGLNRRKKVGDCMNPRHDEQIEQIRNNLLASRKILNAMCEENRQKILLVLLDNCTSGGVRVEEIAKRVNLSRPAVSHHLKLLLDENLVTMQKEGTKHYYHITGAEELLKLKTLLTSIEQFLEDEVKGL